MKSHYITLLKTMIDEDLPDDPFDALDVIRAKKAMMSRRIGDVEMCLNQACRHNEVASLCDDLVFYARRYESLDAKQRRIENRIDEIKRNKVRVGGD